VPVELSGPIADEMRRMLDKMDLTPPRFAEIMGRDRDLSLFIANDDYPLETRDLISGILNPTDMIDILLSSLLKYRNAEKFARIKDETTARLLREQGPGGPAFLVALAPRGQRFAYTYEDAGAAVHETWLTELSLLLDSASLRVHRIALRRCARSVTAAQEERPGIDTAAMVYTIDYDSINGAVVPVRLALSVNGSAAVTVDATYRTERGYTVFDRRRICCSRKGTPEPSCLTMQYGAYTMGYAASASAQRKSQGRGRYAQRLAKAATLSRKAAEDLRKGNISAAVRALRTLIDSYPETPQAIEAEKVLAGLP